MFTETLLNDSLKIFYRCFKVPVAMVNSKELEQVLCQIPNFKEARKLDSNFFYYLFEITKEDYIERKLQINAHALDLLHKNKLDEDLQIDDDITDEMIDRILDIKDNQND